MVLGSSPVVVTSPSDFAPASSKEFLDIQATIECGFTLKRVRDMTRTYRYNPCFKLYNIFFFIMQVCCKLFNFLNFHFFRQKSYIIVKIMYVFKRFKINFKKIFLITLFIIVIYEIFKLRSIFDLLKVFSWKLLRHCPSI